MKQTHNPIRKPRTGYVIPYIMFIGIMLITAQSGAGIIAYEGFDYPNGSSIFLQNGGAGWLSAWSTDPSPGGATCITTNGSLTYPETTSTGEKLTVTGDGGTNISSLGTIRILTAPLSGGTVYFRILAENLNDGIRYFGLSLYNDSTEMMLIGQGTGIPNWTVNKVDCEGPLPGTLISSVDSSAPAMLLIRMDFNAGTGGTNELITFWVNPDLSQPENATNAVGGGSFSTDRDYGTIDRVRISSGGYHSTYGVRTDFYMDEITISSTTPFACPTISQSSTGEAIALSWPTNFLGWVLQAADALDGSWTNVPDSNLITETNLPTVSSNGFYRLLSP